MGAGTFQKVVRHGSKNERSRRQDRGAEAAEEVWSGEGVSPSPADYGGLGERRELPQRVRQRNC